jgi:hypothetical protein
VNDGSGCNIKSGTADYVSGDDSSEHNSNQESISTADLNCISIEPEDCGTVLSLKMARHIQTILLRYAQSRHNLKKTLECHVVLHLILNGKNYVDNNGIDLTFKMQ